MRCNWLGPWNERWVCDVVRLVSFEDQKILMRYRTVGGVLATKMSVLCDAGGWGHETKNGCKMGCVC